MPGTVRKGTDAAGGVLVEGSGNVFANNSAVVRLGDLIAAHGLPPHVAPVMASASGDVFTNNIPTCRAGDVGSCGHPASGSGDVFTN
jgi:uncharacterized Zn-binding protein involved in type VI secretion